MESSNNPKKIELPIIEQTADLIGTKTIKDSWDNIVKSRVIEADVRKKKQDERRKTKNKQKEQKKEQTSSVKSHKPIMEEFKMNRDQEARTEVRGGLLSIDEPQEDMFKFDGVLKSVLEAMVLVGSAFLGWYLFDKMGKWLYPPKLPNPPSYAPSTGDVLETVKNAVTE